PGQYQGKAPDGETSFTIKAKSENSKTFLTKIFEQRKRETEATSLKFSNLSEEEMALWESGEPSLELQYLLSYWNDLAHWLMQMQEDQKPYDIQFGQPKNQIPNKISISFPEVELGFSLSEEDLISIIPSLATVKSPLAVHEAPQEEIGRIT